MNTYISDEVLTDSITNSVVRTHPWAANESEPGDRYYDFKAHPELIARALDNFKGWSDWSGWEGVQLFYKLLEWLNGPDSRLESNGCGFRGPRRNPRRDRWRGELLTDGGLIFLFRDVGLNLSAESAAWAKRAALIGVTPPPLAPGRHVGWLLARSHEYLRQLNPELDGGCVALTLFPTFYSGLPLERDEKFGHEVAFQWWAWGDTVGETMGRFREVVATMFECLKRVSAESPKEAAGG